jgi:transcriptional accessory protein Tex/SPT6
MRNKHNSVSLFKLFDFERVTIEPGTHNKNRLRAFVKAAAGDGEAELLDDGATIPFIARYRKEVTGSLDEVAVTAIRDRLNQLKELDDRRQSIIKSLEERELLTDELKEKSCRGI